MKVVFKTNRDAKFGWYFPEEVCCKPEIGEYVKSMNDGATLKVCAITHCYGKSLWNGVEQECAYLEVELT